MDVELRCGSMNQFTKSEPIRAKDQILNLLKMQGPQTATHLAGSLGISPMAIRQHLQALSSQQWVTYEEERQPMGRPVKLWQLTPKAHHLFPDNHADLVTSLVQEMVKVFGENGLDVLVASRTQAQIHTYATQLSPHQDWRDRVSRLADIRSREGYMAEVIEQSDNTLLLVENHCSICQAAQMCSQFCYSELEVFNTILGPTVEVERTEHILSGDRRCAYRIAEVAS